MSILVKGMKMPDENQYVTVRIWGTGLIQTVDDFHSYIVWNGKATELPPHGRLIDENDVMKSAEELRQSPWYKANDFLHAIRKDGFETAIDLTVKDAPTIIEAEGVDE